MGVMLVCCQVHINGVPIFVPTCDPDRWAVDDIRLIFAYAFGRGRDAAKDGVGERAERTVRQHGCNLRFDHLRCAAGP